MTIDDKTKHGIETMQRQLYQTAASAGLSIIPGLDDDKCCRLMAYLYVYGGSNEQMVLDSRITSAIFYAQARLNIFGGERPTVECVQGIQSYIKSITDFDNPPDWVLVLEKEYGIKSYRSKK